MMKRSKRLLAAGLTVLFLLPAMAAELTSEWRIVLPEDADVTERYAAQELQTYLEKSTGVKLAVAESANPPSAKSLVIGTPDTSPAIAALRSQLQLSAEDTDSFAVKTIGGNLYLAGNNPRSALYAVYAFLRQSCGIRWLWPGADGEFVPVRSGLNVGDWNLRWVAPFKYRGFHLCSSIKDTDDETETWMARHNLNILRSNPGNAKVLEDRVRKGIHVMFSNHNITLPSSLMAQNPELFALLNGKRATEQLCWTHPEIPERLAKQFIADCRRYPQVTILSLFPSDNRNYCQCGNCAKLAVPERWFTLFNQIAAQICKELPEMKFASIAYEGYREPPTGIDLRYLELMEYCQYDRCFVHNFDSDCQFNKRSLARVDDWQKKDVRLGIYGYEFDMFPDVSIPNYRLVADQLRKFRELKIVSVIPEVVPRHNALLSVYKAKRNYYYHQRSSYYVYAELLSNPDADPDRLLEEYARIAFEPEAGAELGAYFVKMGKAWSGMPIHLTHYGLLNRGIAEYLLNPGLISEIDAHFQRAERAAAKISDNARLDTVLKEIALEKSIFQDWVDIYRADLARKRLVQLPRAGAPDDFTGAFKIDKLPGGAPGNYPTSVRMNWDDDAIYADIVCSDPRPDLQSAGVKTHDTPMWASDDSVEIFLASPEDIRPGKYRHFAVNTAGNRYDAIEFGGNRDLTWNPDWSARVIRQSDRWSVRIRIPFSAFGSSVDVNGEWGLWLARTAGKRKDFSLSAFPSPESLHNWNAYCRMRLSKVTASVALSIFARPENYPIGEAERIAEAFRAKGYQAAGFTQEREFAENAGTSDVIVICHPNSAFTQEFYQKQLLPALKRGAIVIFSSYAALPLERYFGIPELALHWSGWEAADAGNRAVKNEPSRWLAEPNDLLRLMRECELPSHGYRPAHPANWEVAGSIRMKNGDVFPYLMTRKVGRGLLVVTTSDFVGWGSEKALFFGNTDQLIALVENLCRKQQTDVRKSASSK